METQLLGTFYTPLVLRESHLERTEPAQRRRRGRDFAKRRAGIPKPGRRLQPGEWRPRGALDMLRLRQFRKLPGRAGQFVAVHVILAMTLTRIRMRFSRISNHARSTAM